MASSCKLYKIWKFFSKTLEHKVLNHAKVKPNLLNQHHSTVHFHLMLKHTVMILLLFLQIWSPVVMLTGFIKINQSTHQTFLSWNTKSAMLEIAQNLSLKISAIVILHFLVANHEENDILLNWEKDHHSHQNCPMRMAMKKVLPFSPSTSSKTSEIQLGGLKIQKLTARNSGLNFFDTLDSRNLSHTISWAFRFITLHLTYLQRYF